MPGTLNITDINKENTIPALWRQAFRPFFLAGALFSLIAITLWVLLLSGHILWSPHGGGHFWHGHEMIFGFVTAIIVGFLLTAVQTWTGIRATNNGPLIFIFALWLLARIVMATSILPSPLLVAIIDVSFLPVCAGLMARLVIKANNRRNLFFVPVLLLLASANGLSHYGLLIHDPELVSWANHSAVLLVTSLITVVGGRVIPMFSANGTGTPRVPPTPKLDKLVLVSTWLLALLFISQLQKWLPGYVMSGLFAISCLLHTWRAAHWRPQVTFGTPLVWSLHLAYWFIPLGFALFSAHFAGFNISFSSALHSLTAGAMGCMILAMLARVSLGHSGRPLVLPRFMAVAFFLLICAALLRVVIAVWPTLSSAKSFLIVGLLWGLAFGIYCVQYASVLLSPRADGRPG